MFSNSEWNSLIDKLRHLTEGEKVKWVLDGGALSTEIQGTTYIVESADEDGSAPWLLRVRTGDVWDGQDIDELRSIGGFETQTDPRTKVTPLREIAYRMALGGPKFASRLLDDLAAIDPTEPPEYGSSTPF